MPRQRVAVVRPAHDSCNCPSNPCCMPLQSGIMLMAIIDIVIGFIHAIILFIAALACFGQLEMQVDDKGHACHSDQTGGLLLLFLLFVILDICLGFLLYNGALYADRSRCQCWLIIAFILFLLSFFGFYFHAFAYVFVSFILWIIYRIYMMWCVWCFINYQLANPRIVVVQVV